MHARSRMDRLSLLINATCVSADTAFCVLFFVPIIIVIRDMLFRLLLRVPADEMN